MREYSKITPQFWLGKTGKKLRGHPESQIVAFYLLTTPHANMLGLYYLPKMFIAHETGMTLEGACKGLSRCIEAGFCLYDEESEMVWVIEMAIHQIGELKASDNRCVGIQNEYDKLPENLYFQDFYAKYSSIFHMKKSRGNISPSEAPCKPLRSQEQEQEQEQELNTNNNTRASFEKIETQGEYVAKPVRELFNMTLDWKPNQQTFSAIAMRNGLPAEYSDDRLAGFVSYWQAEPIELTQGQWENKFATYLKRPVPVPKDPKPKSSPRNQQPQHDEYIQPPLYVPKPKVENPATPEQIKEIMDEMRRKIAGGE